MRLSGSIRRDCIWCKTAALKTNCGPPLAGFSVEFELSVSKKEDFTRELAGDCVYMELICQLRPFNRRLV